MITEQEKDFYKDNGYLIVKNQILVDDIKSLLDTFGDIVALNMGGDVPYVRVLALMHLKKNKPNISSWIYETINQSLQFNKFIFNAPIQDIAAELVGTTKESLGMISPVFRFDVPGDAKNIRDWHQDSNYFLETESGDDAVVVWMPLTEAYADNGSVILCPGSHKDGRLSSNHKKSNGLESEQFVISRDVVDKYKQVTIEASPGDVVFIHMDLIHRSGVNITERDIRYTAQIRFANNKTPSYRPARLIPEYPEYRRRDV